MNLAAGRMPIRAEPTSAVSPNPTATPARGAGRPSVRSVAELQTASEEVMKTLAGAATTRCALARVSCRARDMLPALPTQEERTPTRRRGAAERPTPSPAAPARITTLNKRARLARNVIGECMNHPASLVTVLILSASVLSAQTAEQPKSDAKASTALTWGPAPPVFPKGA